MRRLVMALLASASLVAALALPANAAGSTESPSAASAAACSYAQLDVQYPKRTVAGQTFTDTSVWIALRRNTSCGYYFVIHNRYASGRSFCGWQVRTQGGALLESGNCPPVGGRVNSDFYAQGSKVYGTITTRYPDGRVYHARTINAP